MLAQIVGASFQHGHAQRPSDRARHRGQISVVQLILQVAGAGGDEDPTLRQQRGHEIGKSLARARAGFDDEMRELAQGVGDRRGHEPLLPARRVAGYLPSQRAMCPENVIQVAHATLVPLCRRARTIAFAAVRSQA